MDNSPLIQNPYELDALYKPFPDFETWSKTEVNSIRWDKYASSLATESQVSPEQLARAREIVKRATAINTGAIENLYDVDRGFTYTVAMETAMWQAKAEELKGPQVRALIESQLDAYNYVLDLATKATEISESAIRTLHETICRNQEYYQVRSKSRIEEITYGKTD